MKSITEIAKETGIHRDEINRIVTNENLNQIIYNGNRYVDRIAEDKIHNILFFTGKIEYVIIESKINKQ